MNGCLEIGMKKLGNAPAGRRWGFNFQLMTEKEARLCLYKKPVGWLLCRMGPLDKGWTHKAHVPLDTSIFNFRRHQHFGSLKFDKRDY